MHKWLMVAVFFSLGVGVPLVVWLTKLVKPPKPKEESIHRGVEEARRRIDRIIH